MATLKCILKKKCEILGVGSKIDKIKWAFIHLVRLSMFFNPFFICLVSDSNYPIHPVECLGGIAFLKRGGAWGL